MRVRAIDVEWSKLEPAVMRFVSKSQTLLTPGTEYDVHAVSVYKGVVFVLVVDDLKTPVFYPSALFETACTETPRDWKCNLIRKDGVDLVLGPDFVARDLNAYNSMVDQEFDQAIRLRDRIG